jgi:hypothetical protein
MHVAQSVQRFWSNDMRKDKGHKAHRMKCEALYALSPFWHGA